MDRLNTRISSREKTSPFKIQTMIVCCAPIILKKLHITSSLDVHSVKNVGRGLVYNGILYCLSMICCQIQKSVSISSFSWRSLSSQPGASGSKGMALSLITGHPQLTTGRATSLMNAFYRLIGSVKLSRHLS